MQVCSSWRCMLTGIEGKRQTYCCDWGVSRLNKPMKHTRSAEIRSRLPHPVVDADGHFAEYVPAFLDYLQQVGGAGLVEQFESAARNSGWYAITPEERRAKRVYR